MNGKVDKAIGLFVGAEDDALKHQVRAKVASCNRAPESSLPSRDGKTGQSDKSGKTYASSSNCFRNN